MSLSVTGVFGQPFVKQFALCYRTIVLSCLSVCNVGVLWPNSWMDQDETSRAGRPWPCPRCVSWGPSCLSPKKGQSPQFLAHVYCGQRSSISATAELCLRLITVRLSVHWCVLRLITVCLSLSVVFCDFCAVRCELASSTAAFEMSHFGATVSTVERRVLCDWGLNHDLDTFSNLI